MILIKEFWMVNYLVNQSKENTSYMFFVLGIAHGNLEKLEKQ